MANAIELKLIENNYNSLFSYIYDQDAIKNWIEEIIFFKDSRDYKRESLLGHGVIFENCDVLRIKETLKLMQDMNIVDVDYLKESDLKKNKSPSEDEKLKIIFLGEGDWLDKEKDSEEALEIRNIIEECFDSIQGKNIILCVHYEDYMKVPTSLRCVGRFDRFIRWTRPKMVNVATEFIRLVGTEGVDKELQGDKKRLGAILLDHGRDDLRILRLFVVNYKRKLFLSGKRSLNCGELIHLLQGSLDGGGYGDKTSLESIAIHEAGHAVVGLVSSEFKIIPEFVSIVENGEYLGLVRDNSFFEQVTLVKRFKDVEREIKTYLGGRAAEELFLGNENVGLESARSDIRYASFCATKMVKNGFLKDYYESGTKGRDIYQPIECDSSIESERIDVEARKILDRLYEEAKAILIKNKTLVKLVQERLLKDKILTEKNLQEILKKNLQTKK